MEALMTLEGATDGEGCRVYVERVWCPTLHPGDLVVMDTLRAHKVSGIREAIQGRGAELISLPPYSPELCPLAPGWSTIKTALRGIGARARRALDRALPHVLWTVTEADAAAWFAHCGYVVN